MKSRPVKTNRVKIKQLEAAQNEVGGATGKTSRVHTRHSKQAQFRAKLEDDQRSLSAKKTLVKKKRKRTREKASKVLYSLSSLLDGLPSEEEALASAQAIQKKVSERLSSKSRQNRVVKETKQLAAVLAHPGFQANPFLAIQEHLANTLPAETLPTQKKEPGKKVKKKRKSSKKGTSVQQMEE